MQSVFGDEDLHVAMREFDSRVRAHGLTSLEVAVRWIAHHSALGDGDGIVLGASRVEQVRETVGMVGRGRLEGEVLGAVEGLWGRVGGIRGGIL